MNSAPDANSEQAASRASVSGLGIDRAVSLAVLVRAWQFIGGSVSTLLIALWLTKNEQGFYYVFANLLALQAFFELGLNIVIINVSSHEWAKLGLDASGTIVGETSARTRLISLGRLIFRWYAIAAFGFIIVVGASGYYFLGLREGNDVIWQAPWFALVASTGLLIWTLPYNAMLEGCNQVARVQLFRLIQAIIGNLVVWSLLLSGAGLWAVAAAAWARLLCELYFLLRTYRRFFAPFYTPPAGELINWRDDLWPMQWRLAISGVLNYFALNLFGLVMFYYHDPATAGRMGMTWTLVSVTQAAALSWVQTRTPLMGRLIVEKQFDELDQTFRRLSLVSLAVMVVGGLCIWGGIHFLVAWWPALADRLLDPTTAGILVLGFIAAHLPHCQALYIRAHKRDNLLVVSVLCNISIGLLVWILGARFGPRGAAVGYLAVAVLLMLPLQTRQWFACRAMNR